MELMQATSRTLILFVLGLDLALLIAAGFWLESLGSALLAVTPIVAVTCLLGIHFLPRYYLTSHLIWQAGLAVAISLALLLFRRPEIAFAYALLPLLAVVTMGWPAGLLALLTVGLLTLPLPLPTIYRIGFLLAGIVTGALGWASTHALLMATQWSLYSYNLASKRADEALEQRVEFKQIQQDLVRANRELARLSDRLRTMQQVAEEARRAREEFVANVSHELRTPLNMIIGFSEMLLQSSQVYGTALPTQVLADVAAIERNSQHLSKLVDDVLDLSQVECVFNASRS
jgi:signal transduction histidine kinase